MMNDRMCNLRLVYSNARYEHSATGVPGADEVVEPHPADADRAVPPLDPVVHAMLEHVRIIPPLPPVVRARALARARAMIAALHR
jgi:hypothetical protein